MDLVQRLVVRTQSRRQQLTPERGVLFPAQAQLVLVPGAGDLSRDRQEGRHLRDS